MNKSASLMAAVLLVGLGLHGPLPKDVGRHSNKAGTISQIMPPMIQSLPIKQVIHVPIPEAGAKIDPSVNCQQQACIALTFDDGPNPLTTPKVLSELQAAGAKATFFVVGSRVPANAELLRHMNDAGMEIGNHSWGHPDFTKLTPEQIHQQIDQTQTALVAAGVPAPKYFRPPYEVINPTVSANVPMPFVLWNVDPKDWSLTDPNQLIATIDAQIKPGSVIILHDIWNSTTRALPQIVEHLKPKYKMVTISQLLDLPPDARGVYSHQ